MLLAARKVGPTGKAIGIDMTQEMIDLARRNAAKSGLANVEYHLATIDKLPLADASVDCVISNCVINLAPDKPAVFREIARVLKQGLRISLGCLGALGNCDSPLLSSPAGRVSDGFCSIDHLEISTSSGMSTRGPSAQRRPP